jgi:hypothetical protein
MRSLCADLTAKLCCSDAGLEIETSVVGEVTALYSQPMFMRVHRVQLGRDSSHFSRSVIPMLAIERTTCATYLNVPFLAR